MAREKDPSEVTRKQKIATFSAMDVYLPYPAHDPYVATMAASGDGGIAELIVEVAGHRYLKLPADRFAVRAGQDTLSLTVDDLGLRLDERIAPGLMVELAWRLREMTGIVVETEGWMPRRRGASRL